MPFYKKTPVGNGCVAYGCLEFLCYLRLWVMTLINCINTKVWSIRFS